MAIGSLVSNRNFGSFVGSGKLCKIEKTVSHSAVERSVIFAAQYGKSNMFFRKSHGLRLSNCSLKISCSTFLHAMTQDGKILKPPGVCTDKTVGRRLPFVQSTISWSRGKSRCYPHCTAAYILTSGPIWLQCQNFRHVKVNQTSAHYKSNDFDITKGDVDALAWAEGSGDALFIEGNDQIVSPWWDRFPKRWVIVMLCFFAFLLCNMDRVNMSIAILPMSKEFNWNSATVGLIQSSFFWGYLLTQIVGGIWADKIGGKLVLGFGVVWWSIATILTPIAARIGLPFLLMMRAFMGIGEGVAMPAMNNIISKWIPVSERSRSLALVYSGMYLGSVTGLAFSPVLIDKFGWASVFYSFGSLGSIWFALWLTKAYSSPKEDPGLSAKEKKIIFDGSISKERVEVIPWKLILSKAPVWALIISHFCHNWGTFILLTWMPTYYNQVLKFNLTESGLLCVLPWLTMAVFANIGGWIADTLVSRGFSITRVRKIMQSIGFLGPAFFLTLLSRVRTPAMAVLCMACCQGSDAFSQSGLYSNHQDIGPRYAGVLLGLSNTAGVLAGVFGTAATGYILQQGSWDDVFKVAVALYIIGTLVWNIFATGEKIID
ncbi:ascorbate transporter, chloroplastic-like [Cucurbita maxima]|uniref:Ascorbate transporter, chloroplastic-like n=1 Tax=Cucurbita maxima TaxID=3661 RepID=A0A6J1II42_CUCMA|nr:ascorbate transporter, chloroplastic-like [Cucurbita maxima]